MTIHDNSRQMNTIPVPRKIIQLMRKQRTGGTWNPKHAATVRWEYKQLLQLVRQSSILKTEEQPPPKCSINSDLFELVQYVVRQKN